MSSETIDKILDDNLSGFSDDSSDSAKSETRIIYEKINPCLDFDTNMNSSELFQNANPSDTIPVEFSPRIYVDKRGCFSESINCSYKDWHGEYGYFIKDILANTKQANRNITYSGVCRGFHAQKAPYCQGKLVECLSLTTPIWDIIIDARPDSKTFQQFRLFKLNGNFMNKLWIPRGFLHCMIASKYTLSEKSNDDSSLTTDNNLNLVECPVPAEMQYFADNVFNAESEVGVNPETILPYIINTYYEEFKENGEKDISLIPLFKTVQDGLVISEKDQALPSYIDFMQQIEKEYKESKKCWYK